MGQAPRPRPPRGRLRCVRRRPPGRVGRPELEARRPRHRALQPPRRPGPLRARRLDAGRQPAHLGLRDQLRRPRRPGGREGQPAHAEAHAPHLGGERRQRALRVHELPDAGGPERGSHEAGRRRVRVGRRRGHRGLRHPARAQRWRHPGRRGVEPRAGEAPRGDGLRERHRPGRRGLRVLEGRAHPGRGRVAPPRQEGARPAGRRPGHRVRAPWPPDDGRLGVHRQARRHGGHVRRDVRLHDRVRQPAPLDEAEADHLVALRQLPGGVGHEPPHLERCDPAGDVRLLHDLEQVGDAALLVHQNKADGKLAVRCLAPAEGLGITDPEKRANIGEDKITLFQRHARGEL